jgi:predicted transcriptional regulator
VRLSLRCIVEREEGRDVTKSAPVIEEAVKTYASLEDWWVAAIDESVRAADESRVVDHKNVAAWVRSWGANLGSRRTRAGHGTAPQK